MTDKDGRKLRFARFLQIALKILSQKMAFKRNLQSVFLKNHFIFSLKQGFLNFFVQKTDHTPFLTPDGK